MPFYGMKNKITVRATILADAASVWTFYTAPEHITKWNFADDSWHCPFAENDMRPRGKYRARMEAKDGSFGFDFEAVYEDVIDGRSFTYTMTDGRQVVALFEDLGDGTGLSVSFDAENQNSEEMQRSGWQAILDNFKKYAEENSG